MRVRGVNNLPEGFVRTGGALDQTEPDFFLPVGEILISETFNKTGFGLQMSNHPATPVTWGESPTELGRSQGVLPEPCGELLSTGLLMALHHFL